MFLQEDRSQLLLQLFKECSEKSAEVTLVSKEGIEVPMNLYIINFYSKMISSISRNNCKIFLEEDVETIYLLKDLLTKGKGRFQDNKSKIIPKLLSAAKSLDIILTENFNFQESNMTMGSFVSEIDSLMTTNYTIDKSDDNVVDSYNMSTELFIDKIDKIFTSTLKKDSMDELLAFSNKEVVDTAEVSTIDKVFQCQFCDKTFSSEKKLTRHSVCHTQFSCNICNKGFRLQSIWKLHMKNEHEAFNEVETEIDLISSSNTSENNMMPNDEYCCKHCDRTFSSKSKFMKHSLCHTNHRCSICGKGFRITSLLARHLKVDHGIQVACNLCEKSFENESILRKHRILKHALKSSFIQKAKAKMIKVEM